MITIIDYNAGNLTSVELAFAALNVKTTVTDNPKHILAAEKVVFPGVGAASAAMFNLRQLKLVSPIKQLINSGVPFLGICLGMQILFQHSAEDNGVNCLGIFNGNVQRFVAIARDIKIPHMGWNSVQITQKHPVLKGVVNGSEFYFVHGYYPIPIAKQTIYGVTEYAGVKFTSIVGKNNVLATQFHPEKSGRIGLKILDNFSKWDGQC